MKGAARVCRRGNGIQCHAAARTGQLLTSTCSIRHSSSGTGGVCSSTEICKGHSPDFPDCDQDGLHLRTHTQQVCHIAAVLPLYPIVATTVELRWRLVVRGFLGSPCDVEE